MYRRVQTQSIQALAQVIREEIARRKLESTWSVECNGDPAILSLAGLFRYEISSDKESRDEQLCFLDEM